PPVKSPGAPVTVVVVRLPLSRKISGGTTRSSSTAASTATRVRVGSGAMVADSNVLERATDIRPCHAPPTGPARSGRPDDKLRRGTQYSLCVKQITEATEITGSSAF